MKRRSWTRKELILTFNLYCKLPFGKLHSRNPDIIYLAEQIGRTANAVALKLVNFASLDPELKKRGIKGMSSCSKHDKLIFEEFSNNWDKLVLES
jgi:putative restriction endonuclease